MDKTVAHDSSSYSYLNDSTYTVFSYSDLAQIYYIICGSIAALGNLYLIVLFIKFSKLRDTHCNWLIILLSLSDFLIGKQFSGICFPYIFNFQASGLSLEG